MKISATGYCTPLSIRSGEPVTLHLSGDGVFDIEVVRDARRSQVVWTAPSVALAQQAVPEMAPSADRGGRNLYTGATTVSFERPLPPGFLHGPPA